ncbi:MAG TPA: ribonuclease M5 [Candidatus Avamphibacillus sp.]|nr:ribonuclease M5 [Candidatus Avamphibacillus sp.]
MKVKEIIVVEGRDDTTKIQQAVHADTIETNGSAINKETLKRIEHAKEKRGVIIFTDPDYPGQRIRSIIDETVPGCKHAFLTSDQARAKHPANKSIGIEHASIQAIRKALAAVYELAEEAEVVFKKEDLLHYGLIGSARANQRRKRLGEFLRIGHTNGKQLLKRLNMFQITRIQLEKALLQIRQEEANEK